MKRATFDELKQYAWNYWGLQLVRNEKSSRGWWSGCWKTGYSLSGQFPGFAHGHRRYSTLKEVAKAIEFPTT